MSTVEPPGFASLKAASGLDDCTFLQPLDADHGFLEGGGVPREEEDVAHDHDRRREAESGHVRGHRVPEHHDGERERRREDAGQEL